MKKRTGFIFSAVIVALACILSFSIISNERSLTYSNEIPQNLSFWIPLTPKSPPQVTGFTITVIPTGNTLHLSWDALNETVPDFLCYRIYRSEMSGFIPNGSSYLISTTNSQYLDCMLIDGATYYYRVTMVNTSLFEGDPSGERFGMPMDSTPPAKVTGVAITVIPTGNMLNVSWTASTATDLVNYKVYRSVVPGFTPSPSYLIASPTVNHYLNSGLVDGTTYYYKISAVDEVPNEGMPSNQASGTPQDTTPPSQVMGVVVLAKSEGNKLDISWMSASGGDVAGYRVWRNITSTTYTLVTTRIVTYFNDTGLIDRIYYKYKISAYDEVPNYGLNSTAIAGVPRDTLPPSQVTGVKVTTKPEGNKLDISWIASIAADLLGYRVYRNSTSSSWALITTRIVNYYNDTGLVDGRTYWYRISAYDEVPNYGLNSTPTSGKPQDIIAPAQVTGLTVTNPTTGKTLDLAWTANTESDLSGYNIYRRNGTGSFILIVFNRTLTTYKDITVLDGVTYFYRVAAIDEVPNEGLNSTIAGGISTNILPPARVTDLTIVSTNNTALYLSWKPNAEPDLKLYRIYRSNSSGFSPGPANNIKNVTTPYYNDTGLSPLEEYYYRVSAMDIANLEGAFSDQKGFPSPSFPKPSNLKVTIIPSGNTLSFTWNNVSGAAQYKLYRSLTSFCPSPDTFVKTSSMNFTQDTGLIDGTLYYYRVTAVSPLGVEGEFSDEVNATPSDTVAPPPITGVTITVIFEGNILNITWNPSPATDFVAYWLYRNSTTEMWSRIANLTTPSYCNTGLINGKTYWYKVSAVDEVPNQGENSTAVSGIPEDTVPPPAVTGLHVTGISNGLNLTWDPSSAPDIEHYNVYMSTSPGFTPGPSNNIYNATHPITFYLNNTLQDGMTYYFKVAAVDDDKNIGIITTQISGPPPDPGPPSQVTGIIVTVVPAGNALNLQWDDLKLSVPDVVGYRIYRHTVSGFPSGPQYLRQSTTNLYYNDTTGLADNVTYYYIITAYDEVPNEGPDSVQVNGTPQDTVAPTQVTGVVIHVKSEGNMLDISWNAIGGDCVGYQVWRNITKITYTLVTTRTVNYYNDTGLMDGTRYFYMISAYDEVPNKSENSTAVSGTPRDTDAPPAVTGLAVTVIPTGNTLNLTWSLSTAPDIDHYNIYMSTIPGFTPGPSNNIRNFTHPINFYLNTTLIDGLTYYFKIRAEDDDKNIGLAGIQISGTPADSVAPTQVTGILVTVVPAGNALNLQWDNLSISVPDVAGYRIYRHTISGFPSEPQYLRGVTTNLYYNDTTGLADNVTYYYLITAYDEVPNEGPDSVQVNGTPLDTIAPPQIVNLNVMSAGVGNTLQLTWAASTAADFSQYLVYRNTTTIPWTLVATRTTNSYTDMGLTDGMRYFYKVAAKDDGGPIPNIGLNSTVTSAIPTDTIPPSQVVGLTITGIPPYTVSLTWIASSAPDVTYYKVYRSNYSATEGFVLIGTPNTTSYVDIDLVEEYIYFYKVSAVDEVPNEGLNSSVEYYNPYPGPPPAVTGLAVTVIPTGNTLNLTWEPIQESDIDHYNVYMTTIPGFTPGPANNICNVTHPTTYYLNNALTDGVTYYFKVAAVDDDNNIGPIYTQRSGTPQDTVSPLQPAVFNVTNIDGALYLNWTMAQESDFVNYELWRNGSGLIQTLYNRSANFWLDPSDNLIDGTFYYYEIRVFDEIGYNSTATPKLTKITQPTGDITPPRNITTLGAANFGTGGNVRLTWPAPIDKDITYYKIYRSGIAGFTPSTLNLIGTSINTYYNDYDPTLNGTGVIYYYKVHAADENNNTATGGNEASVAVIDQQRPIQVLTFTAIARTDGSIMLNWTAITPPDFQCYNLYRWQGYNPAFPINPSTLIVKIRINTTLVYTDNESNLIDGEIYTYKIAVADEVSDGPTKCESAVAYPIPPTGPIGLTVINEGTGDSLNLTWYKNPELDVQYYRVYRNSTTQSWALIANSASNFYQDRGLIEYQRYFYFITAVDEADNEGPPSTIKSGIPIDTKPPSPPTIIIQISGRTVIFLIISPPDLDVGCYNIYRSTVSGFIPNNNTLITSHWPKTGEFTSYIDPDLAIGRYYYKVTALDEKYQESLPSNEASITIIPPQVTGVRIFVGSAGNKLTLQWTSTGTGTAGYCIFRNSTISSWTLINTGTETYYNDTGLVDGRTYWYKISAYDAVPNYGLNSTPVSGVPKDTSAPVQVTGVNIMVWSEGNKLIISWMVNPALDLAGYRVWRNSTATTWTLIAIQMVNYYNDTGLVNGRTYWYKISAFDEVPNYGLNSTPVSGVPKDTLAPAQVMGVKVSVRLGGSKLDISWNPSFATDLCGYRIFRNSTLSSWTLIALRNVNYYNDTGLVGGRTYWYKISAYDEVPNYGLNSTPVSGIPLNSTLPPTPLPIIEILDNGQIDVCIKFYNITGIDQILLIYSVSGGIPYLTNMSLINSFVNQTQVFRGIIPQQRPGTLINFSFIIIDIYENAFTTPYSLFRVPGEEGSWPFLYIFLIGATVGTLCVMYVELRKYRKEKTIESILERVVKEPTTLATQNFELQPQETLPAEEDQNQQINQTVVDSSQNISIISYQMYAGQYDGFTLVSLYKAFNFILQAFPSLGLMIPKEDRLDYMIEIKTLQPSEQIEFFQALIEKIPETEVRIQLYYLINEFNSIELGEHWEQTLPKLEALVDLAQALEDRKFLMDVFLITAIIRNSMR